MGYLALRTYFDNLAAPAPRVRDRRSSDTSAGSVSPEPREVGNRRLPSRGSFFAWLRGFLPPTVRSQAMSFGVRADTPSTRQTARAPMPFASLFLSDGADRDALNVARRSRALDALADVVASTQDVLAAQAHVAAHKAARSPNP